MSVFNIINIVSTLLPIAIQLEPKLEADIRDILALIDKLETAAKAAEAK